MTNFRVSNVIVNALLIFLITFTHHQWLPMFTVVRADGEFSFQQCQAAKDPEICQKCFDFDPRSKEADLVGLLNVIFDCMNYYASSMQDQMWRLNLNSTADAQTKQTYEDCVEWFTCAKSELFAAKLGLKIGDSITPSNSLLTALRYRDSCRYALSKTPDFKDGVPKDMKNELDGYFQLYDAASKMLENYGAEIIAD
ncbi:Pectinesterase inhibitor domain [Macleaya cordata]|uniref:Pectinesterase inhibitor domain n=1 Tax=Macleaya cordata TaxID=56857 RepID=A0A200R210_MACCD|nr:Pectinesterase inhibitor domain [Macleaya cordata]